MVNTSLPSSAATSSSPPSWQRREHKVPDHWQRQSLPIRTKNILQRLQEQSVPHAILSGHTAYSSPRQRAILLEAKRLVDMAQSKKILKITVLNPAIYVACSAILFSILLTTMYLSPGIQCTGIVAGLLIGLGPVILCLELFLFIYFRSTFLPFGFLKVVKLPYFLRHLRFFAFVTVVYVGLILVVIFLNVFYYSVIAIDCAQSDIDNFTSTVEMTTTYSYS